MCTGKAGGWQLDDILHNLIDEAPEETEAERALKHRISELEGKLKMEQEEKANLLELLNNNMAAKDPASASPVR